MRVELDADEVHMASWAVGFVGHVDLPADGPLRGEDTKGGG